jgi:hypothetical protein
MKNLCIILPGKIGDIIICLPIAKYYYDKGYKIIWPVWNYLIDNFKEYINYVEFVPVSYLKGVTEAKKIAIDKKCEILDLSFTNQDCWDNENTKHFLKQAKTFDEFRYELASVNFSEKWNLVVNRKIHIEENLKKKICIKNNYAVVHFNGSDSRREVKLNNPNNNQIIEINPCTSSIFDWITILENAEYLVMYDSCFANLIEQLNLQNKKFFLKRSEPKTTPILKNKWIII